MDILHITDSLNPAGLGGYESYLHYMSKMIRQNGHRSYIVTQSPKRDTPRLEPHSDYDIIYLPGNLLEARKWEFFSAPEDERACLIEHLFETDDMERNVSELTDQLRDVINSVQPDVINAHSTYVVFNRVLQLLIKNNQIPEIPLIGTIHGLPKHLILPDGTETTDYKQLVQFCPFDVLLAVSETVAEALREHLLSVGRECDVKCHYIGINLDVFYPYPDRDNCMTEAEHQNDRRQLPPKEYFP